MAYRIRPAAHEIRALLFLLKPANFRSKRNLFVLLFGFVLTAFVSGCKTEKRMPAANVHAITRELASAAAAAAPGSDVHADLRASDEDPESSDYLDITIRAGSSEAANGANMAGLLQSLGNVATRRRLAQDSPAQNGAGILFNYRHAGFATHTVHIRIGTPAATQEVAPGTKKGAGRLAIILDDLGVDRGIAEAVFALPYPLTISVLPDRPHSAHIAEEAHRRGYQVMLHLPMESVGNGRPESRELQSGMSPHAVRALVNQFLHGVPEVAGVNNHQGSQSTTDAALMDALMPVLRDHQLFYIDSRTTAATVAYDTARRMGVPAASRNVPFLDDVADVAAVRGQLQIALREARQKGEAVAIGHPHPATLKALSEVLPTAKDQGVRLVFASELVH